MEFAKLAEVFRKLESVSEKNQKTEILARFIKEIDKDSLKETFMLLQGMIFYPWEDKDIGIAEKFTIEPYLWLLVMIKIILKVCL